MSSPAYRLDVALVLLLLALWLGTKILYSRRGSHSTKLRGPPSTSRIFGLSRYVMQAGPDISAIYEEWAARYGPVYEIPFAFGFKKIVITDPMALAHFYNSERTVYVRTESDRLFLGRLFGRGLLWAEGETHRRQRKALSPAFSNAAIRRLTAHFYDSAEKVKTFWDATLESSPDGAIIDVQQCLDSVGLAGFSHDFQYLEGKKSPVTEVFEALQVAETTFATNLVFLLAFKFPFVLNIPTRRMRIFGELRRSLSVIAQRLLENTRREKEDNVAEELTDKSVIGLLLRAEGSDSESVHLTQDEVVAQNVLLLAGYETISKLAKHPEAQDKLRKDLTRFGSIDPTWDQLVSQELPYLDATVHEVLRLHPAVPETLREASKDDVIPLGTPIVTPSGETISSIAVAKGSAILAPIRCINRSEAIWGPDAKEFKPERWFDDITVRAKELQGHRHLLSFHDGPRICLGKSFALTELKAALLVLVRNFVFEFPDGPETKIETHLTIVPRPKVAGQNGAKVPMRVTRVE
ncbi:cytochrome P450 [Mycena vulgaris]|nr:cytochrome P450 [Mycena vulgaris]